MESVCCACAGDLAKADEIVCNGFCKSSFHLQCVRLTTEIRDTVAGCSQLFWMCNACKKMMDNARFRQAITSTNNAMQAMADDQNKVLDELRKEIALNTTKINTILQRTPLSTTPRIPLSQQITNSRKRPRLIIPDETPQRNNATEGTRDVQVDDSIPLAAAKKEKLFWLYLSGFDPQATTSQIVKLVKSNLNTDKTVDVVKLVPKGKTLEELTFVSFKAGINIELKDLALSSSTWQKGIKFRPFDFQHNSNARTFFRFQPTPGGVQSQ
ncbi:uncharacterized protein LOC128746142 [Sabethes cyaneus]|uniref:uncharacterized protein LOC128746142 n=1 Tax=Sabethes cyaneus TaxID=53552 RepID=UPI00237E2BE8|nr:uncharacterized protein LOC128746142 [Sabethes cyaneus]